MAGCNSQRTVRPVRHQLQTCGNGKKCLKFNRLGNILVKFLRKELEIDLKILSKWPKKSRLSLHMTQQCPFSSSPILVEALYQPQKVPLVRCHYLQTLWPWHIWKGSGGLPCPGFHLETHNSLVALALRSPSTLPSI